MQVSGIRFVMTIKLTLHYHTNFTLILPGLGGPIGLFAS